MAAWACQLSDRRLFHCGYNPVANPPCAIGDGVRLNGVQQPARLTIKRLAVWTQLAVLEVFTNAAGHPPGVPNSSAGVVLPTSPTSKAHATFYRS